MDIGTIIGIISGLGLVLSAIMLKASIVNFFDISSILIVFGGTVAATLNSFSLASVIGALKSSVKVLFVQRIDYIETLREMLQVSTMARQQGSLALEKYKTEDGFLKKGLMLTADGMRGPDLRNVLTLEREATEERHAEGQEILEKMAELAPAWGMIGTLIGLVIMLLNLEDPSAIGPAMAVALLTTFYGALWANFMLMPAATKLEQRTKKEMVRFNMIIETMVSVSDAENPRLLQERLLSFLPPRDRQTAMEAGRKVAGGQAAAKKASAGAR